MRPVLLLMLLAACSSSAPEAAKPAAAVPPAAAPAAAAPAAPAAVPTAPSRLITGAGVRVRAAADAASAEVVKLSLGTVVTELEQSAHKAKVGDKEDVWVRVRTSDGKEGWVFGGFTQTVDPAKASDALLALARARSADPKAGFAELADLVGALERLVPTLQGQMSLEARYLRLVALQAAVSAFEREGSKAAGGKAFIDAHKEVFMDEISASYMVGGQAIDDVLKEARGTPLEEPILWSAAIWPTGGECEGDPMCVSGAAMLDYGEYAKKFPKGPHVKEALDGLKSSFEYIANEADFKEYGVEKKDMDARIAELEAVIKAAAPGDAAWTALIGKIKKKNGG